MSEADAELFTLATKVKPPPLPHAWGARCRVPASRTQSGFEQIEKWCPRCHLVRITIVGGTEPRAYRIGEGPQFYCDADPECVPVLTDMGCKP